MRQQPFRIIAITLSTAVGLAAPGGADHVSATLPPPSTDTSNAALGPPEGRYRTPVLAADDVVESALAAGFDESTVDAFLAAALGDASASTVVFELRLADGGWSQFVSFDGEPFEHGWRGTYEVIDGDTIVATDPCGSVTYAYQLDGDVLTIDFLESECNPGDLTEQIAQTMIYESSPFTRQTESAPEAMGGAYVSSGFAVPFSIELADWLDATPSAELEHFVTWEATDVDRGLRILSPVSVYVNGAATESPLPADYRGYLVGLADHGAELADTVETTVGGYPATITTITLAGTTPMGGLDGALGCQEPGLPAADCFGPQMDLLLRLAAIDVEGTPVLVWVRDIRGTGDTQPEYATFDEMLASLTFEPSR